MPAVDLHMNVWPEGVPHHLNLPDQSVAQNLVNAARRNPDHPALIYLGHTLSYGETLAQVEALAGYLQHRCGVKRGDRVLLYMQNSPQFIIGYYAIMRADAAVIPVNPMSRHAELIHYAQDADAHVMLAGQELLPFAAPLVTEGKLKTIIAANYGELADPDSDIPLPAPIDTLNPDDITGKGVVRFSAAVAENITPDPHRAGLDDLALIPYSSGTTGQPKGCTHTHRSVQATAIGGQVWAPMTPSDVSLSVMPLFHVAGMQAAMNGPIYSGATIVLMTRWDRTVAATLIQRHRVTRWRSIATMAIDLVNDPNLDQYDLSSLSAIGGGGAAMPEIIARKLRDLTGLDYVEGYGLSETIGATHINPPQAPKRQCLGIPVFDVDSRVIDPQTLRELGPHETGEIISAGPQIFQGYWRNEKATAETFLDRDGQRFMRTGDLGYYDENGYFFMVDRVKRMINASGFKVWPAEVEALMLRHPDVAEACIISTTDPRRGENVKAVIVAKPGSSLTGDALIAWCKGEMAAYKCPRTVEFTDALPKSGAGKVLWRELQEIENQRTRAAG